MGGPAIVFPLAFRSEKGVRKYGNMQTRRAWIGRHESRVDAKGCAKQDMMLLLASNEIYSLRRRLGLQWQNNARQLGQSE